ncbi:MAG: hypothetical protein J6Z36_02020 [Clostridia bacterium]|nr:hypothetical protein [Clostridia bacterium]
MAENNVNKQETKDSSALSGNERKITYKISPLPQGKGRPSFTGGVFTQKITKLVYINILTLFCLAPVIALFIAANSLISSQGLYGPFAENLGIGYPAAPETAGVAEAIILRVHLLFYALTIPASVFTAAGLAGGIYGARKLVRSEEEFRIKDYIAGIKAGYVPALIASLLGFVVFFLWGFVWDYAGYAMALGGSKGLWITLRVVLSVVLVLAIYFAFWILAVGTNYKVNAWGLVKHSCRLSFTAILQSMLLLILVCAPVFILLVPALYFIAYLWFALLGVATIFLVWGSFTDWVFDLTDDYTAAQTSAQVKREEERRIAERTVTKEDVMSLLLAGGKSAYLAKAIKPLDEGENVYVLPETFTAAELETLAENRKKLQKESDDYAQAHAEEETYKEYNRRFDEREKVLTQTDKKGKKKKFAPRMLNE